LVLQPPLPVAFGGGHRLADVGPAVAEGVHQGAGLGPLGGGEPFDGRGLVQERA
jgi:hypothetical protein